MRLINRITIIIILCLLVNLIGVLWINYATTKSYLYSQLESDLQNAVTSVSMRIGPYLNPLDTEMINATVNAYGNSGFYLSVEVDLNDQPNIAYTQPLKIDGVPTAFIEFAQFPIVEASTSLMDNQWRQAGTLTITGNPAYAYQHLWQSIINTIGWFLLLIVLIIALAAVGVGKMLKPVYLVIRRVNRIRKHYVGDEIPLPNIKEFRFLVQAINNMSERIKTQFNKDARLHESLKLQALQDPTTGLSNRHYFNSHVTSWLSDNPHGYLMFIEITGLDQINQQLGFHKRDEVVVRLGEILRAVCKNEQQYVLCRLSLNQFGVLVTDAGEEDITVLAQELINELHNSEVVNLFEDDDFVKVAACAITEPLSLSKALSLVDNALNQAKQSSEHFFVKSDNKIPIFELPKSELKLLLESAVDNDKVDLEKQAVNCFDEDAPIYHFEIFARLHDEKLGKISAGAFVSTLEDSGIGPSFDRKVIELVMAKLKASSNTRYAINLSSCAINDNGFLTWFEKIIQNDQVKQSLCFEITENTAIYSHESALHLANVLHTQKIPFGVDHVGKKFESLNYLQSIKPDYVKVAPIYTTMAAVGDHRAYFTASLVAAIHNLNIHVIASHIENNEQLAQFIQYQFDGYQGFINTPTSF
ncbi:bifunctional diguanylate cyclase/phosphodiesterase [Flocculibacter collagenilyticus]|uniref:bifunctional diguanylate cyclase/phosphodiesterase n=1 Tax=Flocculibacter collagenilyticus TaxID=2744479 RepID=UPI0018F69D66|nr:EAL domain-containing protein [Flocculibacter collagenilyticus]